MYSGSESAENTLLIKRESSSYLGSCECCAVNDAQLSKLNGEKLLVTSDEDICNIVIYRQIERISMLPQALNWDLMIN